MTRRRTMLLVALAVLGPVVAAGCRGTEPAGEAQVAAQSPATDATASAELTVTGATLSLPTPAMGAAYFVVTNRGSAPDRLLSVSSDQAARAEIHETIDDGGVMRMVARPEGLKVPAGGSLELAPGGAHVMLMDLVPEGGGVELTLTFETHEPIVLELSAPGTDQQPAAEQAPRGGHDDHAGDGDQAP